LTEALQWCGYDALALEDDGRFGTGWRRELVEGVLWGGLKDERVELEYRSTTNTWRAWMPRTSFNKFSHRSQPAAIGNPPGKLLLGTQRGCVECVDLTTGRSLWLYLFPSVRETMSCSYPHGMPPTVATAAVLYRTDHFERGEKVGLQWPDSPAASRRPVVWDPDVTNPFSVLPWLLALLWGGATAACGWLLVARRLCFQRPESAAWLNFAVFVGVLLLFIGLGRVSLSSSLILRGVMLCLLVYGFVWCGRLFRHRVRGQAVALLIVQLLLVLWLWPIWFCL